MDIECPYCEHEQEINHDDGYGYEEDVNHEMECCNCDKYFTFQTVVTYHYTSEKADCLNDSEHRLSKTLTYPVEFSKMRCKDCDYERDLTKEERISFEIGTKEDLFKSLVGD